MQFHFFDSRGNHHEFFLDYPLLIVEYSDQITRLVKYSVRLLNIYLINLILNLICYTPES